ncbi:uncharacterized protein LOC128997510 [Macrosteles quadrilineatus]|uniref:uncharacterized protein LOC128997510 n=1 Tax=Macrosteles quadrilineatus TaxID=74068 RepID=UPI0023E2A5FF|nr:uncharacterized protein LOC128997510 [Macrosteles quadrilineatus]
MAIELPEDYERLEFQSSPAPYEVTVFDTSYNPKLKLAIELPEDYERLEFQSSPASYEVPVFDTSYNPKLKLAIELPEDYERLEFQSSPAPYEVTVFDTSYNPKLKLAIELPEDYERLEFQSSPASYEVPVFDTSYNPKLKLAIELPEDYERLEFQSSPAPYEVPVFDTSLTTNLSVQLGGTATFYCRVRNTREDRVSWVRRRDWHILSSGTMTYTNDERFQVVHVDSTDDWDLQIKYVQRRDNGTYECQVGTKFGILSHYYNLHVIVPTAFILGSGEYHIGEGSTISLVCIIENSPTPPQYVFWYHNDKMVNYDSVRGGVTVDTEPGPKTHSRLIVNKATPADTGNYTCRAPNTDPDTIYVFVSKEGENTAAISRPDSASNFRPLRRSSLAFFSIFFILFTNLYNLI